MSLISKPPLIRAIVLLKRGNRSKSWIPRAVVGTARIAFLFMDLPRYSPVGRALLYLAGPFGRVAAQSCFAAARSALLAWRRTGLAVPGPCVRAHILTFRHGVESRRSPTQTSGFGRSPQCCLLLGNPNSRCDRRRHRPRPAQSVLHPAALFGHPRPRGAGESEARLRLASRDLGRTALASVAAFHGAIKRLRGVTTSTARTSLGGCHCRCIIRLTPRFPRFLVMTARPFERIMRRPNTGFARQHSPGG